MYKNRIINFFSKTIIVVFILIFTIFSNYQSNYIEKTSYKNEPLASSYIDDTHKDLVSLGTAGVRVGLFKIKSGDSSYKSNERIGTIDLWFFNESSGSSFNYVLQNGDWYVRFKNTNLRQDLDDVPYPSPVKVTYNDGYNWDCYKKDSSGAFKVLDIADKDCIAHGGKQKVPNNSRNIKQDEYKQYINKLKTYNQGSIYKFCYKNEIANELGSSSGKENVRSCVVNPNFVNNTSIVKKSKVTNIKVDDVRDTSSGKLKLKKMTITTSSGTVTKNFISIDYVLPGILNNFTNSLTTLSSSSYNNTRAPHSLYRIYKSIEGVSNGGVSFDSTQLTSMKNQKYASRLIKAIASANGKDANAILDDIDESVKYYFQFEPLVMWRHYNATDGDYVGKIYINGSTRNITSPEARTNTHNSGTFIGTVSEMYLIFAAANGAWDKYYQRVQQHCVQYNNTLSSTDRQCNPNGKLYSVHYFDDIVKIQDGKTIGNTGLFNRLNGYGIIKLQSLRYDSHSYLPNSGLYERFPTTGSSDYSPTQVTENSFFNIVNVGVLSNKDYFSADLKLSSAGKSKTGFDLVTETETYRDIKTYNTITKYPDKAIAVTFLWINGKILGSNCEEEANTFYKPTAEPSYSELKTYLVDTKKVTGFQETKPDTIDKKKSLLNAYHAYKNGIVSIASVQDKTKLGFCKAYECKDILGYANKNETSLNKLYNFYGYDFLNPVTLKELFAEETNPLANAKCEGLPDCPASSVKAKCNGANSFTLSDNTTDECLSKGIAYNGYKDSEGVFHKTGAKTSFDKYYGNNAYCSESVSFDLPDGSSKAKAGTLLKWGIDTETDSQKIGTMVVTRKCKNVSKNKNAKWAKYNNTKITVQYLEPIPNLSGGSQLHEIDANFKLSEVKIGGSIVTSDPNLKAPTGTGSELDMIATYDIQYGKDFHWYSDKSDSNKNKSETSISDTSDAKYVDIGYGLPTSFLAPANVKVNSSGLYEVSTYGSNSYKGSFTNTDKEKGRGYLQLKIVNIGSRQSITSTTVHFDKYPRNAIDDDYSTGTGNGTIYYSCLFKLENELFGSECEGEDVPAYCLPPSGDGGGGDTPKGLDVAFRTIELVERDSSDRAGQIKRAFPGKLGSGRTIGRNWQNYLYPTGTTLSEHSYNLLASDIYSKEPIYSIKLTSSTIQTIRDFNRKAKDSGFDPYISMRNNSYSSSNGFVGYKCHKEDTDNFAFCASDFISELTKPSYGLKIKCRNDDNTAYLLDADKGSAQKRAEFGACNQNWFE